jgi:hypothetical protein
MIDPIKLFVGCSANGEDAESQMVLEYTLRKNTSRDVDITWMKRSNDLASPWFGWQCGTWATPFSGFRWAIPAVCNFEGQAIYTDSDMIFMQDIGELWDEPFEDGKVVQAKGGNEGWRYCVAKWHNQRAKEYLLPLDRMKILSESHQRHMGKFTSSTALVQHFNGNWNCVDGEDYTNLHDNDIKILHYSDMSSQMHLKYALPRLEAAGRKHWYDGKVRGHWREDIQVLFDQYYHEALAAGYTVEQYVPSDEECFGEYGKESQADYRANHSWEPRNH